MTATRSRVSRLASVAAHVPHMLGGVLLIVVFSRLTPQTEFGKFAVGYAFANVVGAVLFGWLQIASLRFSGGSGPQLGPRQLILGLIPASLLTLILSASLALVGVMSYPFHAALAAIGFSTSVCIAQYARGAGALRLYAAVGIIRVVACVALAVVVGTDKGSSLLAALGIAGLCSLVPFLYWGTRRPSGVNLSLGEAFRYGGRAALSLVVVIALIHGDRFVVGHVHGASVVAEYSAQADLARQFIYPVIAALSIHVIPTAIKIERHSRGDAMVYVERQARTTLLLVAPLLLALLFFGGDMLKLLLPSHYIQNGDWVVRWSALSAFLLGARLVCFDPLFHVWKSPKYIGVAAFSALAIWLVLVYPVTKLFGPTGTALVGSVSSATSLLVAGALSRTRGDKEGTTSA